MLRHPCILGDPQTKGDKIRGGSLTPAFSGAHKWAEMLRHPSYSGIPKQRGTKSEVAPSHLPSRGPTSGQKCYVTPAFWGIPKTKGNKIRSGSLTSTFSEAHKWAEMLRHPCILGNPQNKGGQYQKWVPHPCLLGSPKKGRKCYVTLASGGSLAQGTKSKVAESGAMTKLWMCNPKEYHQKIFRKNGVSASKNTLKTPP